MARSEPTVLVIEDEEDSRDIFTTVLRHNGYDVLVATDGEAGVRLAAENIPDVILMDLSLPVLDGWEATARLKENPETADIPIVALTVHSQPDDRRRAAEVGCADFLSKPIEPSRVIETVRRLLPAGADPRAGA